MNSCGRTVWFGDDLYFEGCRVAALTVHDVDATMGSMRTHWCAVSADVWRWGHKGPTELRALIDVGFPASPWGQLVVPVTVELVSM